MRTGAQVLVDQLRIQGVDTIFSVPGESFLSALDALYDVGDDVRFVTARHEGGAANMAEAYGKLTGRPGVCFVTRGPGATNASIGLHTATQDSTPLVLLIGQVARGHTGREAFQEIDMGEFLGPITKWAAQVESAERLPEMVSRAFHTAQQGRPGPVALALPEDMLDGPAETTDARRAMIAHPHPGTGDMEALGSLLAESSRPLMVVGGGIWSAQAGRDLTEFAEANRIPVCASFRCQDFIDNRSDAYAGVVGLGIDPSLAARVTGCDLLIAVGARLGDITTGGYTLVEPPTPAQALIHVHPGAEELGRVYQAALPINAGAVEFAAALRALGPVDSTAWVDWATAARQDYLDFRRPPDSDLDLDLAEVVAEMSGRLPDDAIITNGAGNFSVWAHRFYEFRRFGTQLGPRSGAMGYGIPAAVAAKVVHPDRVAVCVTGDGDAMMTIAELATAVQENVDPIVLLFNNGRLGTIRMHQERRFPGRVYGTDLVNPDFVDLARAFGAHAERVERTEEFGPALERCLGAGVASLIELQTDPEQLTPGFRTPAH